MAELKPTFTDVNRRNIQVHVVTKNDVPALAIEEILEDGTTKRLLLLNKYDSKQLSAACDMFLQQVFSAQFTNMVSGLSPHEMAVLFADEDE
ncbi:hypothetical protein WG915_03220 [Corynebacterium sp. H128]|uniref:hypothetical protein n=1 Tax=unclassified Corynebacterium TaxID=2624378 RepID=UPI0030B14BB1